MNKNKSILAILTITVLLAGVGGNVLSHSAFAAPVEPYISHKPNPPGHYPEASSSQVGATDNAARVLVDIKSVNTLNEFGNFKAVGQVSNPNSQSALNVVVQISSNQQSEKILVNKIWPYSNIPFNVNIQANSKNSISAKVISSELEGAMPTARQIGVSQQMTTVTEPPSIINTTPPQEQKIIVSTMHAEKLKADAEVRHDKAIFDAKQILDKELSAAVTAYDTKVSEVKSRYDSAIKSSNGDIIKIIRAQTSESVSLASIKHEFDMAREQAHMSFDNAVMMAKMELQTDLAQANSSLEKELGNAISSPSLINAEKQYDSAILAAKKLDSVAKETYKTALADAQIKHDKTVNDAKATLAKTIADAQAKYDKALSDANTQKSTSKDVNAAQITYNKLAADAKLTFDKVRADATAMFDKIKAGADSTYQKAKIDASIAYDKALIQFNKLIGDARSVYAKEQLTYQ